MKVNGTKQFLTVTHQIDQNTPYPKIQNNNEHTITVVVTKYCYKTAMLKILTIAVIKYRY